MQLITYIEILDMQNALTRKTEKFVKWNLTPCDYGFGVCSLCPPGQFLEYIVPWPLEKQWKILTLILGSRRGKNLQYLVSSVSF